MELTLVNLFNKEAGARLILVAEGILLLIVLVINL